MDGAGRALPLAVAGGSAAWAVARVLENLLGSGFPASVITLGVSYLAFVAVAGGVAVGLYELTARRRESSEAPVADEQ